MTRVQFGCDTGLELKDCDNSSDLSGDSMPTSTGDHKLSISSFSSPKKTRKVLQRKVVSIPIKYLESSSRNKGETAPPSDSWAWRKYGQKPIKGSPYPRGYYRCSSSKGCPARKQVERSRMDPTMLVVTYSSDHNHSLPPYSRNRHSSPPAATANRGAYEGVTPIYLDVCDAADTKENNTETKSIDKDDEKFDTINVAANDDLQGWFSDMGFFSMLESPMLAETSSNDTDVSEMFPIMGEEEEYLFADLGELPECSVVFRRREVVAAGGTQRCGTTS